MSKMRKLLILGGTSASVDVVQVAKDMGIYTIVTDDQESGPAKQIADEAVGISTTDMQGLLEFVRLMNIDGVFCGPGEFNIKNTMRLCKLADLPFYATEEQWDICSNKDSFKELCRKHNVPYVHEFKFDNQEMMDNEIDFEYPVIVKPVDGCSSKGIEVCFSWGQIKEAYANAIRFSQKKKVIIEKYIENGGIVTSVRYIAHDGNLYLSLTGDTYVVDPIHRKALISALTVYPSKYTNMYLEEIDPKVKEMFKSIDIRNGVLFMQSLPDNNNIFFHEMGFRLSGGLTYTITEAANGINDLEMMIRFSLGGQMCTDDEIERIDPYLGGKCAASLCIPLKTGVIGGIDGLDEILNSLDILDFTQYYSVGDVIVEGNIGTLLQHFGRFKFFGNNLENIADIVDHIQETLSIKDIHGNDMVYKKFDTDRLQ